MGVLMITTPIQRAQEINTKKKLKTLLALTTMDEVRHLVQLRVGGGSKRNMVQLL